MPTCSLVERACAFPTAVLFGSNGWRAGGLTSRLSAQAVYAGRPWHYVDCSSFCIPACLPTCGAPSRVPTSGCRTASFLIPFSPRSELQQRAAAHPAGNEAERGCAAYLFAPQPSTPFHPITKTWPLRHWPLCHAGAPPPDRLPHTQGLAAHRAHSQHPRRWPQLPPLCGLTTAHLPLRHSSLRPLCHSQPAASQARPPSTPHLHAKRRALAAQPALTALYVMRLTPAGLHGCLPAFRQTVGACRPLLVGEAWALNLPDYACALRLPTELRTPLPPYGRPILHLIDAWPLMPAHHLTLVPLHTPALAPPFIATSACHAHTTRACLLRCAAPHRVRVRPVRRDHDASRSTRAPLLVCMPLV